MIRETRKVQLTGGSTYIVSLPQDWVKKNAIEKGSIINLSVDNDSLVISPKEKRKIEIHKIIDLQDNSDLDLLQRTLIAMYIGGYDTLQIKSSGYISASVKEVVRKYTRLVMGVEIFEETSRTIVLQNVLDYETFPTPNALKRMVVNVQSMLNDSIKVMEFKSNELIENIISRDDDVDRYHFYIIKAASNEAENRTESVFYLFFSRILERVADHIVNINQNMLEMDFQNFSEFNDVKEFLEKIGVIFQKATTLFFGSDLKTMNQLVNYKGEFLKIKMALVRKYSKNSYISSIVEDISRIGLYSTDIAELTMDRTVTRNDEVKV
ncbi:PhoU domain-containing protein [Caldiplasma sukawensis]